MIEHLGKKFYVSKKLYEDLVIYVNHTVNFDEDVVILLDGFEGSGKSILARQISWVISYILKKNHDIDMIPDIDDLHFNLQSYIKTSLDGEKYQVNILDESRRILNRRIVTRESRAFTDYLSECRKYNQFHIILLPAFHDIDKYIILWRCKMLIHCIKYIDDKGDLIRGQFKNYPINESLIYLWEQGRYKYPKFSPLKFGGYMDRFRDYECFDNIKKHVEKQKIEGRKKYIDEVKTDKYFMRNEVIIKAANTFGITRTSVALGLSHERVRQIVNENSKNQSIT